MKHSVGFTMFEELENTPMPTFDTFQPVSGKAATGDVDSRAIDELYTYVYNIVGMYNDNPFHNLYASTNECCRNLCRLSFPHSLKPSSFAFQRTCGPCFNGKSIRQSM
jgi:hypothetical protein